MLWLWFNYHKGAEPVLGGGLFLTMKSLGVPGTHLIDLSMFNERYISAKNVTFVSSLTFRSVKIELKNL